MNVSLILPLVVSSAACIGTTRGDGEQISAVRELAAFHAIEARGALEVEITVGSPQRVEVFTDANVLAHVLTTVADGTLTLSTEGSIVPSEQIRIVIVSPALDGVDASGATTVTLNGATGERLRIEASGASRISGSGQVKALSVDLSGASRAALDGLIADAVEIEASGACSATVHARETLDVDASGASHVTQRGAGRLRKATSSGASTIETATRAG